MGAVARATEKVLNRFRVAKIMTIAELMLLLNCSMRTVHRRMKDWRAMNSYNCNGRFYTVPQVAQFDADGLWRCREAFFSHHGNLTETVVALVGAAPEGLTAAELGRKLGLNAHSFISRLASHPRLTRKRMGGLHVYLSSEHAIARQQFEARRLTAAMPVVSIPSDAEAVMIFVEMLRHPDLGPERISRQLAAQGTRIDAARIIRLLGHHGLEKKRLPDSESPAP